MTRQVPLATSGEILLHDWLALAPSWRYTVSKTNTDYRVPLPIQAAATLRAPGHIAKARGMALDCRENRPGVREPV